MCVCREVPSGKASWRRWYLGKKYSSEAKPGSLGINQYVLSEQSDVQSSELGARVKADQRQITNTGAFPWEALLMTMPGAQAGRLGNGHTDYVGRVLCILTSHFHFSDEVSGPERDRKLSRSHRELPAEPQPGCRPLILSPGLSPVHTASHRVAAQASTGKGFQKQGLKALRPQAVLWQGVQTGGTKCCPRKGPCFITWGALPWSGSTHSSLPGQPGEGKVT